jgi:hypothetical protein
VQQISAQENIAEIYGYWCYLLPSMKALHVRSTHKVLCHLFPILALIVTNQLHEQQVFTFIPMTFTRIATVRAKLQWSYKLQGGIHFSICLAGVGRSCFQALQAKKLWRSVERESWARWNITDTDRCSQQTCTGHVTGVKRVGAARQLAIRTTHTDAGQRCVGFFLPCLFQMRVSHVINGPPDRHQIHGRKKLCANSKVPTFYHSLSVCYP